MSMYKLLTEDEFGKDKVETVVDCPACGTLIKRNRVSEVVPSGKKYFRTIVKPCPSCNHKPIIDW